MAAGGAELARQRLLEGARAAEPGARVGRGEVLGLQVAECVLHGGLGADARSPSRARRLLVEALGAGVDGERALAERNDEARRSASVPKPSQEAMPGVNGGAVGGPFDAVVPVESTTRPDVSVVIVPSGLAHLDAAAVDLLDRVGRRERALQDLGELERRVDRRPEVAGRRPSPGRCRRP